MKVGIVTEPLVGNYGGIIQNYALQRALSICGCESVTLRYLSSLSLPRYCMYVVKNLLGGLRKRNISLKPYRRFTKVPDNIAPFINTHICITKPMRRYSASSIRKYGLNAIVVGSDQVWRREYNRNLFDMYLAFTEGKDVRRIAYAASFGTNDWSYSPEMTERCSELLSKFDAVSVREIVGAKMCQEHFGLTPKVVLDPTLLLQRCDYEDICKKIPVLKRHYLLTYFLDENSDKINLAHGFARSHSMEIVSMSVSQSEKSSVEEWLAHFRDAAYVITDSFHGTVFSILFHKQFKAVANADRGTERFITLLTQLNLLDNLICGISSMEDDSIAEIDYDQVEYRLNALRTESYAFLNNCLNG